MTFRGSVGRLQASSPSACPYTAPNDAACLHLALHRLPPHRDTHLDRLPYLPVHLFRFRLPYHCLRPHLDHRLYLGRGLLLP